MTGPGRWAGAALAGALLAHAGPVANAGPMPPGAVACGGCHPARSDGLLPSLTGMSSFSIAETMRAFRSGARPATVMDRIAKGFSEEETQAIAVWFSEARPR